MLQNDVRRWCHEILCFHGGEEEEDDILLGFGAMSTQHFLTSRYSPKHPEEQYHQNSTVFSIQQNLGLKPNV